MRESASCAVQMQRMVDNKFSSMLREVKAVNLGLKALLRSQPLQHSLVAWVSDCAVSYSGCHGFLETPCSRWCLPLGGSI